MTTQAHRLPLFVAMLCLALLLPLSAQAETYKGYFVTFEGKTQVVGEFLSLKDNLEARYNGNLIKIPMASIKKVLCVDPKELLVTKRDGKEFLVTAWTGEMFNTDGNGCMRYTFYDEINEQYSTDKINGGQLKEIVFDDDFGDLRKNPKTGRTYPPDYLFDPYDKTPLVLIQVAP